jgi:RNA polymerase sigma-70 factor (ECF subfamily)
MQPDAASSDVDLVRRIAERDASALASLYDRYRRVVFTLALRMLNERAEAEETLLDVFHQVWRQASSYEPGRGSVAAWLVTICRSRAVDRLRSHARRAAARFEIEKEAAASAASPGGRSPSEDAMEADRKRATIARALDRLSDGQRHAIEMAYYQGMTHTEIAAELGEPLGTIKTRIRQGMIALRESLREQFEG